MRADDSGGMREAGFSVLRFADIQHLLPPGCWAAQRNAANSGEFEDESVLFREGSVVLNEIDLEDPLGDGSVHFLVFVTGDLRVTGTISNPSSDGASGLIVLGDLFCRNAVVGGQEIFVQGNLDVSGLFWGDYNHGSLVVQGDASAEMFIASDAYRLTVAGQRRFGRWILDEVPGGEDWRLNDVEALGEYIEHEFINPYDGTLSRDEIIDALREGRAVIGPAKHDGGDAVLLAAFPDRAVNTDNILRIAALGLLRPGVGDDALGCWEFWSDDTFCRIARFPDQHKKPLASLYFQAGDQLGVLLAVSSANPTLIGKISALLRSSADKEVGHHVVPTWRDVASDGPWLALGGEIPTGVQDLMDKGWVIALTFAATRERQRQEFTPATIRELLVLPLVEPYDDFDSNDRDGLWVGDTLCRFRQEGERSGEPALLHVTLEEDGTQQFFYEITLAADGSEYVEVKYCADPDENEDVIYPSLTGGSLFERASLVFRMACRNLRSANERLLAGEPVSDDGFALKHWRKKGYIKGRLPG